MELVDNYFEIGLRLGAALLLGGLVGFERERHGKVAGIRTHSLVSLGSALVMLVSVFMFEHFKDAAQVDPGRIAAQVVTGVGFICAGTIIRSGVGIKGLTTAAGLWAVSGIGLACGVGYYEAALLASFIILFVFVVLSWIGRKLGARDV